ncbi:MAG: DUF3108 domain-containing protein [Bryobacteraceae bacterium]
MFLRTLGTPVVLATLMCLAPGVLQPQSEASPPALSLPAKETLHYGVEWRLVNAGKARLEWRSTASGWEASLKLDSTGLVSKLFKVDNSYTSNLGQTLCAESSFLRAHEGRRRRETRVTFDKDRKKASYLELDTVKNTTAAQHEIDIPECTHDTVGALFHLRTLDIEPGQSKQVAVSDGKKSVLARVDALRRETIRTPSGQHKTIRYEAFLFDNILYRRSGRLYVWITDDDRRTPVQIQVRLQFHIGTITLQLEKEER